MFDVNEYTALARPPEELLHNEIPPNIEVQREKPEHRLIVYMKVQGLSNREIAKRLNYTDAWVSQLTRQRWFRKRLLSELKERSDFNVDKILALEASDSVERLVELRDSAKSEAVRAQCAMNILDRFLGRPNQRIEVKKVTRTRVEEVEALDKELEDIERQLAESN